MNVDILGRAPSIFIRLLDDMSIVLHSLASREGPFHTVKHHQINWQPPNSGKIPEGGSTAAQTTDEAAAFAAFVHEDRTAANTDQEASQSPQDREYKG